MLRPIRTDDREIGSDRKRSAIRLLRSFVRPMATMKHENAIVWTVPAAATPGS